MQSKQLALIAGGATISKLFSVLTVPMLLAYIEPRELGLFALFNSFITVVSVMMAAGLRQFFWIEFFHTDTHERTRMLHETIMAYLLVALPCMVVCVLLWPVWQRFLFMLRATPTMFLLALLNAFFIFFVELLYQVLVYQNRTQLTVYAQVVQSLVTAGATVLFVYQGYGVTGMLAAHVCGYGVITICAGYYYIMRGFFSQRVRVEKLAYYMKQGVLFVPGLLSVWVGSAVNRWIVALYSFEALGIYALLEMIQTAVQLLLVRPLQMVYVPGLFKHFKEQPALLVERHNSRRMWQLMGVCALVAACGYTLLRPVVYHVLPGAYHTAVPLVPLMVVAQLLTVGSVFTVAFIQFCKKSFFISCALGASALILGLCAWLLVPRYTTAGAVMALLLSSLFYFLLTWWYNRLLHARQAAASPLQEDQKHHQRHTP